MSAISGFPQKSVLATATTPHRVLRPRVRGTAITESAQSAIAQTSSSASATRKRRFSAGFSIDPLKKNNRQMYLADGSIYKGALKGGVPHGMGEIKYLNGIEYRGPFVEGNPQGYGIQVFPSGNTYTGDFHAGKCHGKGTTTDDSGALIHTGEYRFGTYSGMGEIHLENGERYVGPFVLGFPSGMGRYYRDDGTCYESLFEKGRPVGIGNLKYENGNMLTGDFSSGTISGPAKLTLTSGRTFEGELEHSYLNGKGRSTFPNGDVYEGDIFLDMCHGTGTLRSSTGDVLYEGEFFRDQKHGMGILKTYEDFDIVGHFFNGVPDGDLKIQFKDGSFISCRCDLGVISGKGTLHLPNGTTSDADRLDGITLT